MIHRPRAFDPEAQGLWSRTRKDSRTLGVSLSLTPRSTSPPARWCGCRLGQRQPALHFRFGDLRFTDLRFFKSPNLKSCLCPSPPLSLAQGKGLIVWHSISQRRRWHNRTMRRFRHPDRCRWGGRRSSPTLQANESQCVVSSEQIAERVVGRPILCD